MALTLRAGISVLLGVGLFASSGAAVNDNDSTDNGAPVKVQETDGFGVCWENIEPAPFVDTVDLSE